MSWQDFEIECTNYLNEQFGNDGNVVFVHMGEADSTVSDIRVEINGSTKFYIEVKMDASQCGQFVLIPDMQNRKFIFSERNSSQETPTTKKIIEYMDRRFDKYVNGGILDMDEKIFYDWVIEHYRELGAKYVITGYEEKFIIFPIAKFAEYFGIKGVYRVKRSGSRSPSKNQQEQVIDLLSRTKPNFSYRKIGDDLIVNGDNLRKGSRFDIDDNTYWLAEHEYGYRVRILSKTANSNVIFSIFLKNYLQNTEYLSLFTEDLK